MANRSLDFFRLLTAARGVGARHVALRQRQIDVYSRTSTVAKTVRIEAIKLYDALEAAKALADKLAQDGAEWSTVKTSKNKKPGGSATTSEAVPSTVAVPSWEEAIDEKLNPDTTAKKMPETESV